MFQTTKQQGFMIIFSTQMAFSLVGQWVNPVMGDPTIPSVVVDKAVF
jgi:hypothetical protein